VRKYVVGIHKAITEAMQTGIDYDDLVLSTVHVGKSESSVLKKSTITVFQFETTEEITNFDQVALDEDGDFDIQRKKPIHKEIILSHQMGTPLADVGMQVWLGSLLLCDWILHNQSFFVDSICLELGTGTGLCSILAGMFCKLIFCTDAFESVLKLCQENVKHNELLLRNGLPFVKVRCLDWFSSEYSMKEEDCDSNSFAWSIEEVLCLKNIQIFLAADVIYDNALTDAFFKKVVNLFELNENKKVICLISIEKRVNFTIEDLDVSSHAYDHFRTNLANLNSSHAGKSTRIYEVEQLNTNFPKYLDYERPKELELWKVIGTRFQ